MKKEQLIPILAQRDPLLAEAVSAMIDHVFSGAEEPTSNQVEAVNRYLHSTCADGDGTVNDTYRAHRRIASQRITIAAIRALDSEQLNRCQEALNRIADAPTTIVDDRPRRVFRR